MDTHKHFLVFLFCISLNTGFFFLVFFKSNKFDTTTKQPCCCYCKLFWQGRTKKKHEGRTAKISPVFEDLLRTQKHFLVFFFRIKEVQMQDSFFFLVFFKSNRL